MVGTAIRHSTSRTGCCAAALARVLCRIAVPTMAAQTFKWSISILPWSPFYTRRTLECRKTFGHIRSINPNMFLINQSQTCQLLKIKMLNGPARNHYMAIHTLLCGIFCDAWEGFLSFFFLTFKRTLWEVVPITKFEYRVVWHHSARPWKNIYYIWFSHFTLTESHCSHSNWSVGRLF